MVLPILALTDSGTDKNLSSHDLTEQLHLPMILLQQPLLVAALTDQTITFITYKTERVHFIISGNHHEWGEFNVFFYFLLQPPMWS